MKRTGSEFRTEKGRYAGERKAPSGKRESAGRERYASEKKDSAGRERYAYGKKDSAGGERRVAGKKDSAGGGKFTGEKREYIGRREGFAEKDAYGRKRGYTKRDRRADREEYIEKDAFWMREEPYDGEWDRPETDIGMREGRKQFQTEERGFLPESRWLKKAEIERGQERCRAFGECGGCQMLHLSYKKQLVLKEKATARLLKPYVRLEKIIGMEQPEHYRNKVNAAFTHDRQGKPLSGVYKEGTHYIIPIKECVLENEKADAIIASVRSLLPSFRIKTYNEDTGRGLLRHVMVRIGQATGQIMVVLVLSSPILPSKNNFVKALLKQHPDITTIVTNVNERKTSMVLGDSGQVLYGKGYIEDVLCGITFRISPKSFYQVNAVQTEKLYNKVIEYAALKGKETVLDAYCGIGTIGMAVANTAKRVIGVELNGDAVKDAMANARRNQIKNIEFYQKDAGEFMVQLAEAGERVDTVLMDPPRSGSDEVFLSSLVKLAPKKVVYVSCNPETLARDLEYLTGKGYRAVKGVCVDMFPFCGHVETCVLLSKLKSTQHIDVKIDLDEMDLTKAESKATYAEIKQYVLEKYGLKVSQLYIAQVKRKHGIIERVNYHVGEGKVKVPQVPLEKEKAIEDALRYFQMI